MQQRDFSLHGAVDLGARQAAAQRQQASAAGGQDAPGGEYVFDVTEATFETDVLERSRTVPVVMDHVSVPAPAATVWTSVWAAPVFQP